jgi:hypothetical protein
MLKFMFPICIVQEKYSGMEYLRKCNKIIIAQVKLNVTFCFVRYVSFLIRKK